MFEFYPFFYGTSFPRFFAKAVTHSQYLNLELQLKLAGIPVNTEHLLERLARMCSVFEWQRDKDSRSRLVLGRGLTVVLLVVRGGAEGLCSDYTALVIYVASDAVIAYDTSAVR